MVLIHGCVLLTSYGSDKNCVSGTHKSTGETKVENKMSSFLYVLPVPEIQQKNLDAL